MLKLVIRLLDIGSVNFGVIVRIDLSKLYASGPHAGYSCCKSGSFVIPVFDTLQLSFGFF
jgi:hypothetical protein